ncbi:uncharacterized protein LOC109594330 [Aethina tumida]|uniref:uncharacterized protein LOC109594330 n=1 Tax=Aethina tumida TaxID=116153 RepID=UPI0021479305|nr:uncharacterized protein LOC109594330 [Aethina tumida]
MATIIIRSSEGVEFEKNKEEERELNMSNVTSRTMCKILQWINYHKDESPHEYDQDVRQDNSVPRWDSFFLNVEPLMLCELIMASEFLGMNVLLDMSCRTMANWLKGKKPEQIRRLLKIENDMPWE